MGYPQPSADQYAVDGAGFFRLNTNLVSPGDIYESDQSGLAFALGPESDISDVQIAYFDDQATPSFMNQTKVDQNRSFVGRLDARPDDQYAPSNRKGRILFWSNDLFDPSFTVDTNIVAADAPTIIQPRLDLIEYFSNQPGLVPQRADKEWYFQQIQTDIAQQAPAIVIPYYGRKYAMINISSKSSDVFTFYVIGVNYVVTDDDVGSIIHQQKLLFGGDLATGAQRMFTLGPTQSSFAYAPGGAGTPPDTVETVPGGMFDALCFVLQFNAQGPAETPLRIVTSDRAF